VVAGAPAGLLTGTLVPVPLPARRRRRRGYNQAERLAAALAARTGLELCDALRRHDASAPHSGLGRRARLAAEPAIRAQGPVPRRAVLVDDVITTGATLAACAHALRRAGAAEVAAVAFARTPGR